MDLFGIVYYSLRSLQNMSNNKYGTLKRILLGRIRVPHMPNVEVTFMNACVKSKYTLPPQTW